MLKNHKPSPAIRAIKKSAMIIPWLCSISIFCLSGQVMTAQDLYAETEAVQAEAEESTETETTEEAGAIIEISEAQAHTEEIHTEGIFLTEISAPDLYIDQVDGFIPEWEVINEGVDSSLVTACEETLSVLPDWVKTKFALSGWTFAVTVEDINTLYLNARYDEETVRVTGAASYSMKKVAIAGTEEAVAIAPLHEMGHWCDWITAENAGEFSSGNDEFEAIYLEEAEEFISVFELGSVDTDSRQELCADLFKYYWLEPELLAEECPGLYEWMDGLVEELQGMQF